MIYVLINLYTFCISMADMDLFQDDGAKDVIVNAGGASIIQLPSIESVPRPQIDWIKSDLRLNVDGPNHYVTLSNNLVLLDTRPQDTNAVFKADATNGQTGANSKTSDFTLVVQGGLN